MKQWKLIVACLFAGSICMAAASVSVSVQQQALSQKLIRLHVIAHSDSGEDQAVKLKVRDAVITYLNAENWTSREAAINAISSDLQSITNLAQSVLRENLKTYNARAELCFESYPTRSYETFSLPAGEYLSLKIVLGDGRGKNWWCVVYPAICMPVGAETFASAAVSGGFTENEIVLVTDDTPEIRLRVLFFVRKICYDTKQNTRR